MISNNNKKNFQINYAKRKSKQLKRKQSLAFSTFNVRSLKLTGSIHSLSIILKNLNIDVIGLQEHFISHTESTFQNNCINDINFALVSSKGHFGGLGFAFSSRMYSCLNDLKIISDRIICADLSPFDNNIKMHVINCYAPIEDANLEDKTQFFDALDDFLKSLSPHDVIIVLGDFNSKFASLSQSSVLGKYVFPNESNSSSGKYFSQEESNQNGSFLLDIMDSLKFRHCSSFRPQKTSKLWTYKGPSDYKAQIDHIFINSKWLQSIQKCRAYKNHISLASDHRMLTLHFALRLRKHDSVKFSPRINWSNLSLKSEEFQKELMKNFDELGLNLQNIDSLNVQDYYDKFVKAILSSAEIVLGYCGKKSTPSWVSLETLELLSRSASDLDSLKNEIDSSYLKDKQKFFDDLCIDVQNQDWQKDSKKMWKALDMIRKKVHKKVPCQASSKEWADYFKKLLNCPPPNVSDLPLESSQDLNINSSPILFQEVVDAAKLVHDGASGLDQLSPLLFKFGGEIFLQHAHKIISTVFDLGIPPSQWLCSLIVPIPKAGNLMQCINYRGISLMSVLAKLYNRILFNRIRPSLDEKLLYSQAGFRKGRNTNEQIHIIRRLIESVTAQTCPLAITFIDFTKAFDSVSRPFMFAVLRHYGVPKKIVDAISILYANSCAKVKTPKGEISDPFDITTGVLQGDTLAPYLFIIVLDFVFKMASQSGNFGFTYCPRKSSRFCAKNISELAFADDVAILDNSVSQQQDHINAIEKSASSAGLQIAIKKTQSLLINCNAIQKTGKIKIDNDDNYVMLKNQPLEVVSQFKYLGSLICQNGSALADFQRRKSLALTAFWKFRELWKSSKVNIILKHKIFQTCVCSVLLYGADTWICNQIIFDQLDTFQRKGYRYMLGINWRDHISNDVLYKRLSKELMDSFIPLSIMLKYRLLTWIGHLLRRKENPLYDVCLQFPIISSRKSGKPKMTYFDSIVSLLHSESAKVRDLNSINQIVALAQNRSGWKNRISSLISSHKRSFASSINNNYNNNNNNNNKLNNNNNKLVIIDDDF